MKSLLLATGLFALICGCVAPTTSESQSPSPTTKPATGATSSRAPMYRLLTGVPGGAVASPNGRWLVASAPGPAVKAPYEPALLLFAPDGTLIKRVEVAGGQWSWLPDSSGVFVALSLPQAPPPLGIMELDGRITTTDVQLADATLSRDGKWIAAERTEGCCMSVTHREIHVSARDGSSVRPLVRSAETVVLLGIDASERVVYRDGNGIARVPLAGGTPEIVTTASDLAGTIRGTPSPDGTVMLIRGYEPARWYTFASDRLMPWPSDAGNIVEDGNGLTLKDGPNALWIGAHTLLVRDDVGALFAYDAVTQARTPQKGRLVDGDVVLAHQRGTLMIIRGGVVVLLDLVTGAMTDTGLDLRPESAGSYGAALSDSAFLVSSGSATYRIE